MIRIAICILTFKRPQILRYTLESILEQELEVDWDCSLIVVDNDAEGTGFAAVEPLILRHPDRIHYVIEPHQGIASARNRALQEAKGSDFIGFIDDDEYARPAWIKTLMKVQRQTDADVVTGPVIPEYSSAPQWVIRGKFFAPREAETGSAVRFVETNNLIMKGSVAEKYQFDRRLDRTGGSDVHFFESVRRDGLRSVWAAEAEVVAYTSAERTSARWLLTRARSLGNRYTWACFCLRPGLITFLSRGAKGIACILHGIAMSPSAVLGKEYAVRSAARVYQGMGTLTALSGRKQYYYTSNPSDPLSSAGEK